MPAAQEFPSEYLLVHRYSIFSLKLSLSYSSIPHIWNQECWPLPWPVGFAYSLILF